jgi:hypothetical protein
LAGWPFYCRRNLPLFVRSELVLKLEPLLKTKAKEKQQEHGGTAPGKKSLPQKSAEVNTRKELAAIAHVSHDTIAKVKTILKSAEIAAQRAEIAAPARAIKRACHKPPFNRQRVGRSKEDGHRRAGDRRGKAVYLVKALVFKTNTCRQFAVGRILSRFLNLLSRPKTAVLPTFADI